MLVPDILEKIGEKAGMDYYVLLSSIHEVLIAKDDGKITKNMLKDLIYDGNRTDGIVRSEAILSDNVHHYTRRTRELTIV